jgi:8-oxo-dGTP diphosphatase
MNYQTPYEPPIVTVDAIIFTLIANELHVMVVKRTDEPFKGHWALPGGYSAAGQTTIEALVQKVKTKAGIDMDSLNYFEQLYTFDTVGRDPRGHAVSISYVACGTNLEPSGGNHEVKFVPVDSLPVLAYDHEDIIKYARERIANKLMYTNIAFSLLPEKFTLTQLQTVYEAVLGRELDKRNFRKKFLTLNLIHETGENWREGAHRPAALYAFNSKTLEVLSRNFD